MVETNIKLDITWINKTLDDMSDAEKVTFLDGRYTAMEWAEIRQKQEKFRDEADDQFTALSVYDAYGSLKVNIPLEQNLIDTYEGRASWKAEFDVQPNGKQANVDELQPAEYALEFYLEWWNYNGTGFYDEAPIIRRSKARYGSSFTMVHLDNRTELKYKIKDWVAINSIWDLENMKNYDPYLLDLRELFPKLIPIRSVFVDEKALDQNMIQKAEDVIIEKTMSLEKIKFMRGNKKWYDNIDSLKEETQEDSKKQNKDSCAKGQTNVRFYYNSLTKDYIIYATWPQVVIHHSKMLYNHGRLPIESCQHYTDENCLYGIGLPRKIKYLKWYKSEILQSLLNNAAMSSGLNFIIGNDGEIEDWNLWGDWVNIWRTTTWAENVKPIQPQINTWLIAILNILDDLVVQDTGENVRAAFDAQSDKVGIVEVMEENKAVRHKSVDENWNLYLDRALTLMLSNIAQFAPALFSQTTEVEHNGKTIERTEFPLIRVKDAVVKQKWKKLEVIKKDNYGKFGYFELKMDTIPAWLGVKIVTASSHTALPLIRKADFDKWLGNKLKLMDMAAMDQSGKAMQELLDSISMVEVNEWMNDVYWFEDKLKSATWKDKIKKANLEKIAMLREKMWLLNSEQQNGQTTWEAGAMPSPKAPSPIEGGKSQDPIMGAEAPEIA